MAIVKNMQEEYNIHIEIINFLKKETDIYRAKDKFLEKVHLTSPKFVTIFNSISNISIFEMHPPKFKFFAIQTIR